MNSFTSGTGFLVLAHPPGTGKGYNTTLGLQQWQQGMTTEQLPSEAAERGTLVWTALRKEQIRDQQGIPLIPLEGRHPGNCRKLPEATVLAQKGYQVREALCMRRCPHVQQCRYLQQFVQEGNFFATTPLLKATHWWQDAGVVVLDEFDPASLIQQVELSTADLAMMSRSHRQKPGIQTLLRWIAQTLASTMDRSLGGRTFYRGTGASGSVGGRGARELLATGAGGAPLG